MSDLEVSTFQKRPAYRYIRESDKLPSTDAARTKDPLAKVKLFDPTGSFTWFIAGYDADTRLAYALTDGFEMEAGDVSMEELVELRGRFGLPIERDLYWEPQTFSEIRAKKAR